ncbi:MAG TPA: M23 family metallopeptidase [Bacilli bacterium]
MMDISGLIKKKVVLWLIGSFGVVGIAIVLVVLLLVFVLIGSLVSIRDSSALEGIKVPANTMFDVPSSLLPIYLQAENDAVSWGRLAAIHKVMTNFGTEPTRRIDTLGTLGFPRFLWERYKTDGDRDGRVDPDNPYDAILSLAHYFRLSTLDKDAALENLLLNAEEASLVRIKESEYVSALIMPQNWLWPVTGYLRLSSPYGFRIDPITGIAGTFHNGIDIPAPRGTPVVVIQDGKVLEVTSSSSGYGKLIRVQHDSGIQSLYGHLSKIGVKRGQQVLRGAVIGWVGSTGKSTGPHLHLTLTQNGQSFDPLIFWMEQ